MALSDIPLLENASILVSIFLRVLPQNSVRRICNDHGELVYRSPQTFAVVIQTERNEQFAPDPTHVSKGSSFNKLFSP